EISCIQDIRKSLRFEQKIITICNALPHGEDTIQTKKILISLFIFSALLVSGYSYFQSSSDKHREFLLNQALLPSFTRSAQAEKISANLKKVILEDDHFILVLSTTETDPSSRQNIEVKTQQIVKEWQKTQSEFQNYPFHVTFEDSSLKK
ncbi:MAG: hypothetical protein ACK5V3_11525, partial [Bdellovibrionales bacterium]